MMPIDPDFGQHSKGTIMESLNIVGYILSFAIGLLAGWWTYRYTLRNNPDKLQELAEKFKKVGK